MKEKKLGFTTRQIHGGEEVIDTHGAHIQPIYQTSNFDFLDVETGAKRFAGEDEGFIYTRLGNPNFEKLTSIIADLENGYSGRVYASGMAAIHSTVFGLLDQFDHMITSDTLYGCTDRLFRNHLRRYGIKTDFVDTREVKNIANVIKDDTKLVFIETPTNPTLNITNIREVAKLTKEYELYLIVDNTFATPYLQRPIELGADVVIHSLTKDMGGHSIVIGGASIYSRKFSKNKENMNRMKRAADDFGGNYNPFEAFLTTIGIQTLSIRMDKKCNSAQTIAEYLEKHGKIEKVYYPGLKSFPQYELANKQMSQPGGMIWLVMKDGYEAGKKLMNSVKLCKRAVSLGSTETLMQHPASMTHRIVPKEEREKIGIVDGGVRLAVGIEDTKDILADLEQALDMA